MDFNSFSSPYGYEGGYYQNPRPPVPPPMAKAQGNSQWPYGFPSVTPGMPQMNTYGGQWVTPPQTSTAVAATGGTFPKKGRPGIGFAGRGGKRPHQIPKPYDPTGKTPAMLLHELFKDLTEKYDEIPVNQSKRYKCVLTVNGREFSMEATSKKAAKQKTAEMVIRTLRPDIPVTPFEDGGGVQTVAKNQAPSQISTYENFVQPQNPTGMQIPGFVPPPPTPISSTPIPPVPVSKKSGPPSKKAKVMIPAVDSALSLIDALRKLCVERAASGPYNPVFDFEEVNDSNNTDKFKKKFIFPEKNIKYTAEAVGRNAPKDMVCLKALKEEFGVTEAQIRAITKRNIMGKGSGMPIVQTLHHVANLCHCTVAFKTEAVEPSIGIGTGKQLGFTCELTLTDHTQDDRVVVIKGEPAPSKHEAKEDVCRKMLKQHFDIDPENMVQNTQAAPPCQQLQVLCAKKFKCNDNVKFEDLGTVGVRDHNSFGFKFKCIVDGHEFQGTGPTKKEAKNKAAAEALRVLFEDNAVEMTSQECHEITEYCKREHANMCHHYNLVSEQNIITSCFASFVFVNSQNFKRMASLAACDPNVNTGEYVLDAHGTVLHHMDPIVLARRSLIRYLIHEVEQFKPDAPGNILEKAPDGLFKLRDDIKLMLFATFPPRVGHSKEFADDIGLLLTEGNKSELSGPLPQTIEDIRSTKRLKSHSIADKIFKWTHLGLQGALLSTIMHPLLLDRIYFATPNFNGETNEDLRHSFYNRISSPTREVFVEAAKSPIRFVVHDSYIYCRADMAEHNEMERIDSTGRRADGMPSFVCKAAIYKRFQQINPNIPKEMPYQSAKALSTMYNHSKQLLYEQLASKGYGQWHPRPSELVDFTVPQVDLETQVKREDSMNTADTSVIDFSLDS